MDRSLRYDVADQRPEYTGRRESYHLSKNEIAGFNHRHDTVLSFYDLGLEAIEILNLVDRTRDDSNLGVFRNRQVRQSVILAAALSAVAVGVHGRGSVKRLPEGEATKERISQLKRANDRTSAQVMAEVLQNTTETLPEGEEIVIESTLTEGVRNKPGKEVGGNPTIAVGAVYGKEEHRAHYGLGTPRSVSLLSMGSDVIDGTTKSVKGIHSSLTALFVTESHVKRHLPDIYVQRWMAGAPFEVFNPRSIDLVEAAEIVARAYGLDGVDRLTAFFLDRPRHGPAMDVLNAAGVATPYDKDGDLLPAVILGLEGLRFPDGRGLASMLGEIGGSAEWAVGVLPLVWRGGQAIGMLTSHHSLTRKDLDPRDRWKERFHFTEEEFVQIQDARFERKPFFTIHDILEDPFAGGISAFGAITDNVYLPFMTGVEAEPAAARLTVNVLTINSLGMVQCWRMTFRCKRDLANTLDRIVSPKEELEKLRGEALERRVGEMLDDPRERKRFRIFFNNEYYPALIPVRDDMVLLHGIVQALMDRGVLDERDAAIIAATERLAPEWFVNSE